MKKVNIGLLGYGTVGKGVETLLKNEKNMTLHAIFRRPGKALEPLMTDKIEALVEDPAIDTVVEAMGGLEPAHTTLKQAILHHKNVVTANKALVNAFGEELNQLAIQNKVSFLFSAACGGGIPFLPTMAEAMKKTPLVAAGGILNGTTNFIIDKMERENLSFDEALGQAQALRYAEADPTGDLNGTDTMYKLRLAMAVIEKVWIDQDSILIAGIQNLKAVDIEHFKKRQWVLRLLAHGRSGYGKLSAYVQPTLLGLNSEEASIHDNNNLAWFKTFTGVKTVLTGQGAGSIPTATNVLRDLSAIQNTPQHDLEDQSLLFLSPRMRKAIAENGVDKGSYYVRTDKKIVSPFLDQDPEERWEDDAYKYTITTRILILTMHEAMQSLSQQGEVFFAMIDERGPS